MALGFSKPRHSPIAIDFGSDSLKLLQLSLTDPPQLVASASAVLPEGARTDAGARMAFLSDALRNLLKSHPFKGRRAICSIPAFQTLIQHLELAKAEHEDFDAQIGLHLIQRFNVDPNRMVVRNHCVGKVVRDGTTMQQVVCIAARRDAVMRYIELANRCKLEVVGMHSEPIALVRAQPRLTGEPDGGGVVCNIDIGAGLTKLVIAHGRELAFAKTVHAAGDHLTRELAQRQGVSFDQARQDRGRKPQPASAVAGAGTPGAAGEALPSPGTGSDDGCAPPSDTIESLVDELRMSIRYYQSIFPERPILKLMFLGGESQDVSLCQAVARSVRLAAQLGDPFDGIDTSTEPAASSAFDTTRPQPGWAVPLGLCFSEANL
jgi:type IV pilus assembly protein PilM